MANSCAFCLPENVFSLVSFLKVLFPEDRLYGGLLFPYSTLNTLFHGLLESIGADENVVVSLTVAYLKIICPFNVVLKPPPIFFSILQLRGVGKLTSPFVSVCPIISIPVACLLGNSLIKTQGTICPEFLNVHNSRAEPLELKVILSRQRILFF